jgi:hypothetical protein
MTDQLSTITAALTAAAQKLVAAANGQPIDIAVQARVGVGTATPSDFHIPFSVAAADGTPKNPGGGKPSVAVLTADDPVDYATLATAANDAQANAQRLWGLLGLGQKEYEVRRAQVDKAGSAGALAAAAAKRADNKPPTKA